MQKARLSLHPSESVVVQASATIYAAYIASGQVSQGAENDWMKKSTREAIALAQMTAMAVHSDGEMG